MKINGEEEEPSSKLYSSWATRGLDQVLDGIDPAEDVRQQMDRYFLNDLVVGSGIESAAPAPDPANSSPLEELRSWMRSYRVADLPPPRRLHAGELAIRVITAALPAARQDPGWRPGPLAHWTGIPIVHDERLAANAWQLVDPRTGEVVDSGTCGPSVEECQRVVDQVIDELTEQAQLSRRFFDYY